MDSDPEAESDEFDDIREFDDDKSDVPATDWLHLTEMDIVRKTYCICNPRPQLNTSLSK